MSHVRTRRVALRAVGWCVGGAVGAAAFLLVLYGSALLTLVALRNWWEREQDDEPSRDDSPTAGRHPDSCLPTAWDDV